MTHSLNEIESLCRKAARGAGFSWGLAEEAGSAARWLEGHGLDGAAALSQHLRRNDRVDYKALVPDIADGPWRAKSGQLCPIITGAALCDQARLLAGKQVIQMGPTSWPILLLPFADAVSVLSRRAIRLSWRETLITAQDGDIHVTGTDGLTADRVSFLTCGLADTLTGTRLPRRGRATPNATVLAHLTALAARTYAPATEASRLAGAGAGLSDND